MRRAATRRISPERPPKSARMTAEERRKKVEKAAADFTVRFEEVMRELAQG